VFHRKNYFYADLPKNYQISQFDLPLCVGGHLEVDPGSGIRRVGITRVHLEEDTGKSTHLGGGGRIHDAEGALIDFNRSGIPLMEVVSEPDIRSPEEARAYAQELRAIVLALGISDARLEEGSLRFDANVSLRPERADELGVKVEVKNMNSLRSLQRALAFEIERQTALLDKGETIAQETRHWDEEAGRTEPGRSKEESSDYRYFPEPDLVPIQTNPEAVDRIRGSLPELPARRRARYIALGVEPAAAATMVSAGLAALFDDAVSAGADPRAVANWLTGEITAHLNRTGDDPADLAMDGRSLAELVGMIGNGELSSTAAKEVLIGMLAGEGSPQDVAAAKDLMQISDASAIALAVDAVIEAHPVEVARIKDGDERLAGFLVGQVMKATAGKADPRLVDRLIRERVGL
jgi:aspartyl-tRNA(Asn)/glutamyl-tRNA(Gln) amidotransferase subunit B